MGWRRPLSVQVAAGLAAAAFSPWHGGAETARLRPDDPEVVATGRAIDASHCASSHGADLEGQPDWRSPGSDGWLAASPRDETGHAKHRPDQIFFDLTKYGTAAVVGSGYDTGMPAFGDVLTDEEIVAALSTSSRDGPRVSATATRSTRKRVDGPGRGRRRARLSSRREVGPSNDEASPRGCRPRQEHFHGKHRS